MSYLVLSMLAVVPVLMAVIGLVLLFRPRYAEGYGSRIHQARATLPQRVVRAAGGRVLRRLPHGVSTRVVQQVETWLLQAGESAKAGRGTAEIALGVMGLAALVGAVVLVLGQPVLAIAVVLLGVLRPIWRLRSAATQRQRELEQATPALLELLATLIGAGLTFRHALVRVTERTGGPLGDEMRTLLMQMEFGWSPEGAMADLTRRCSAPTVVRLAVSARQSIELGAPIADALQALADDARLNFVIRLRMRAEQLVSRGIVVIYLLALGPYLALLISVVVAIGLEEFARIGIG